MRRLRNFSGVKLFYKSAAIRRKGYSGATKETIVFLVATKLEQYTCTCLINYLTFSGFFKAKKSFFKIKVELFDYLFSFYGYRFIIKLVGHRVA